ncbi:MAG: LamG domain-containing protein, partial [Muribaculaceae bacterium]|nr:LamG domain-containing protein [Muribaculaceae bacterium]
NVIYYGTSLSDSFVYEFDVDCMGMPASTFDVAVLANIAAGGTVSGEGTYQIGSTCTLTATPNTGYTFFNWTENGEMVSCNQTYCFTVTGNRNLVANFVEVEEINLPIPTAGLIAYYPFNGNANDESGNGNHGSLQGDVPQLTTDRFGNENSAYLFGGYYNQGWVYVPNSGSLQLDNAMSMSFWINLSGYDGMDGWGNYSNNAAQAIICKEGDRNGFNTCLNQHTDGRLNVHSWNNNGSYDINTYQDYTLGEWLHCVVTIENNLSRIYINGVLQQDSINNQVNFSNANNCNMYIGIMHAGGMWYPFNGKIDDVILYNRALTQQEVQLLYSVNDGLVAYYPFDGDVNDYSGNGNHGTIVGNVTPAADRFGNPNSAYSFPGYAFNYVSVPDTEILHLNTFTLSAWVYSEAGDYGGEHLINKGRDMTNGSYRLRVRGVHGQNDYNGINAAAIEEYPETGQWHMITGTVEGDQARFYIDGVLQSEATLSHPFNYNNTEPLTLGCHYYSGVPDFWAYTLNGIMDEVRIYSRVLTPQEVMLLYNPNFSFSSCNITASANPTEGGTVIGGGIYQQGQTCTLTATANTGYNFTNWTKDGTVVSTNASYSFTVTGSGTYVANFSQSQNTYTISASVIPTAGGSVSGAGNYNYGETCTLTATANTGYNFVRWTKNGTQVSTNPSYSFTVTENANCVAYFRANSYTISASANPTEGGTVSGAGTYNHGTTCTLTATANEDYSFTNWTKDG